MRPLKDNNRKEMVLIKILQIHFEDINWYLVRALFMISHTKYPLLYRRKTMEIKKNSVGIVLKRCYWYIKINDECQTTN